jgi:hypothetical protein
MGLTNADPWIKENPPVTPWTESLDAGTEWTVKPIPSTAWTKVLEPGGNPRIQLV